MGSGKFVENMALHIVESETGAEMAAGVFVFVFMLAIILSAYDSYKRASIGKEPILLIFLFLLLFTLSIRESGIGDLDFLCEFFTLIVIDILLIKFLVSWYVLLFVTRQPGSNHLGKPVLGLLPMASFIIIFHTLNNWASFDVMDSPFYIAFYTVLGFAWIYIGLMLMFFFFDLSWRDDAINLNNSAAMIAVAGGFIALTMIYAGANIGSGPGWWCVVYASGLGVAAWISFSKLVNLFTDVFERITVERDFACGIRMCFYWLAGGLLLGRACAGDWTS
ncbi:MAG: hypothetical protein FWF87_07165, partial [Synergistaceae bacterium]|nr:hypothetical protein [Synergistaceae bacterium]